MSDFVTQNWVLSKPAARGPRGIVVSQSMLAAKVGVQVLEDGGNAIDAAVATALALAVVEPWNSGLGGIGFAVVHRAGQPKAEVVDFGPISPGGVDPSLYPLTGQQRQQLFVWPGVKDDLNIHGPLSVAVPGAVAGYSLMTETWGTKPFAELVQPAVALARQGLAADWWTTLKVANAAIDLRRYAESRRIYMPDDLPPAPPTAGPPGFLPMGNLAATLERLGSAGPRDFYEGEIARSIAADIKGGGGVLDEADLAAYRPRFTAGLSIDYRGRTVQTAGGLTAAPTMRRVLADLAKAPLGQRPDAQWFVSLAEALRAAYAERLAGLGDTDGEGKGDTCTTHLTVVDAEGTMVSMTTTLLSSFGSRLVLPGSGVLMNNGMMWFDPRPNQPNSIAPRKRPLTNMSPIIVARDGKPWLAGGASGGRKILAAVVQLMAFIGDFGMDPAEAGHHPRIDVSGGDTVVVNRLMPPEIVAALAARFPVQTVEQNALPGNFANPNVIVLGGDGLRTGMSDIASPWSAAVAQR
ncbi:MAG: gamma-glutamyltransferase [Alphaproteobacteria bacterium]|nr:gamma-glutamyltransferase [Alphaproteobacteria bacterium]